MVLGIRMVVYFSCVEFWAMGKCRLTDVLRDNDYDDDSNRSS